MTISGAPLDPNAIGLRLIRFAGDRTFFCEPVIFSRGYDGVEITLRRASLSGRVEIEGDVKNHQADVLTGADGSWDQVIALDEKSYRSLKTHWMRCRVDSVE